MALQQQHYVCQLLSTGCGAGQHLGRDAWSVQCQLWTSVLGKDSHHSADLLPTCSSRSWSVAVSTSCSRLSTARVPAMCFLSSCRHCRNLHHRPVTSFCLENKRKGWSTSSWGKEACLPWNSGTSGARVRYGCEQPGTGGWAECADSQKGAWEVELFTHARTRAHTHTPCLAPISMNENHLSSHTDKNHVGSDS